MEETNLEHHDLSVVQNEKGQRTGLYGPTSR